MMSSTANLSALSVEQLHALAQTQRQEIECLRQSHLELMRVISHDLRAPLRHLISFSPLLEESVQVLAAQVQSDTAQEAVEDATEFAQTMAQAANKMATMLEGLSKLSKLAQQETQRSSVVVFEWLHEWLKHQNFPAHVSIDCPNDLQHQTWLIDPQMLRAIFAEALANAMQATRDVVAPEIAVRMSVSMQQELMLEVADNGIGCRPELSASLDQAFTKVHPEKYFPGPGVGLAVVHMAAQKMGARVVILTQPNQGFSLKVILKNKSV